MTHPHADLASTQFVLPPDARVLEVSALSERLRTRIGPVEKGFSVVTRPGHRIAARLVAGPLAELVEEFREPTRLTDAVFRFARSHSQDPFATLEMAFDALAALVEARLLVPRESPDASVPVPSLAAGQVFASLEIEALVRSLEDSEVYRVRTTTGAAAALKVSRDDRTTTAALLTNEADVLTLLDGGDSPRLLDRGVRQDRAFVVMEWCEGVPTSVAAQRARSANDRPRLHRLVGHLLNAYSRLHARGVLHGDVHPGNCLTRSDGRVVILDFGHARLIDATASPVDLGRTGLTQFHDPGMADALLAGHVPPAATPGSEQYAVAVLVHLLLTGLHPLDASAVTTDLLKQIATGSPRPFAARGVASWPGVEAVAMKALATKPANRFDDMASFARAFSAADIPDVKAPQLSPALQRTYEIQVAAVLYPGAMPDRFERHAWFALRTAVTRSDPTMLGAADVVAARLGSGWLHRAIAAQIARARWDGSGEAKAMDGFVEATHAAATPTELGQQMFAAAEMLSGTSTRRVGHQALARWAEQQVDWVVTSRPPVYESVEARSAQLQGALMLVASGAVGVPDDLRVRLDEIADEGGGGVWLWASAYDVFAEARYVDLAFAAPRPESAIELAFALLRFHQLTGELRWVTEAVQVVELAQQSGCPSVDVALLITELSAPESCLPPPFLHL